MMVLEGTRVIDITQFISGSRCTQILADMGAQVIKVEPPQGDTLRLIFSLMAGAERNYSVLNRNKYGVSIDWRKPEGQDIIRGLARMSDIFVHNLIPGTLERSRLGYEDLQEINPNIIYAAISGFGSTGANPERAAFDIIVQATSGQFWNSLDDLAPPSNYWGDLVSGAYAAVACLLALIHRMKTGKGQFIDISMQDVLYFNNYRAMMDRALSPIMDQVEMALGRKPGDVMNSSDRMPFYGFFRATDGKVAIVALTTRQWKDLSEIIGRPEMTEERKFNNIISQIHNHKEAVALIEEWTCRRSSDEIIRTLESRKIPCGTAYSSAQVNVDENLTQRGMFTKVSHGAFGDIDVPGVPFKFSETPGSVRFPAPQLGKHNRMILEQLLGLSKDEVDGLYEKGVIA